MERGSKSADSGFQDFDFNEVELIDNRNVVGKNQQNETAGNFSKVNLPPSDQNNELLDSPSENNGLNIAPSGTSSAYPNPTLTEASQSQMQKPVVHISVYLPFAYFCFCTREDENVRPPSARDDQPQLNQMNANPDTFGHGHVSHYNSNPLHEHVELVSSPGSTNESFHQHASPNQNLMQPTYSGFEGSDSSHGDATDEQQTTSSLFSPLIMEKTQSFSLALAEKIPEIGSYVNRPFYSEHEVNSVQPNQLNDQIGTSQQPELPWRQRVEPVNRGKAKLFPDPFELNNGNNNFNDNQQALLYPNLFPQSPSGIRFLNGGSSQINQQAPTWISNKENDLYRPLASSGSSQVNQFKATNPQCYNFILPSSSAPLRPQQLNNPLQLLNQVVPNMPNPSDLLLQHSMLTKQSMPMELMPQHFSYQQHNEFPTGPGAYSSQICSTILPESSMTSRTPILPPHHQINPLEVSDLRYPNSLQSEVSMLSRYFLSYKRGRMKSNFAYVSSHLIITIINWTFSSHQLPANHHASNQFSMMPSLPNSGHHNSELSESSILPRLQTMQLQGLLNQTARPIATYPNSGTSLSSLVLNFQQETGGTSAADHQMETSLFSHKEQGISGKRGHARSRFELGESSSFKRFRRESNMPQASSAEQVNMTSLSLQNEASTSSNIGTLFHPRPIRNSVYDPIFERIGLPIDPHLRLFANN
ncbi:hypothetical protein REPUB_Repub02eG0089600 [Reevesia pubescens]